MLKQVVETNLWYHVHACVPSSLCALGSNNLSGLRNGPPQKFGCERWSRGVDQNIYYTCRSFRAVLKLSVVKLMAAPLCLTAASDACTASALRPTSIAANVCGQLMQLLQLRYIIACSGYRSGSSSTAVATVTMPARSTSNPVSPIRFGHPYRSIDLQQDYNSSRSIYIMTGESR